MASISVTDRAHTSVRISVDGLQYDPGDYSRFVYKFFQNGTQILASSFGSGGSRVVFSNEGYLGNNWFAPGTTYSVSVDCYYNGNAYPVGPTTFTTTSISPPSGSITPAVYPTVKDQGAYGNCVAMSLSTAMEIFKAKARGTGGSYENFSVSYIFGSDGRSDDWMMNEDAVTLCRTHGSPRWELVATRFPDLKSKSDSTALFQNACLLAQRNAQKQAFTGSRNIDFYDCAAVASAIRSYGYFMFNFNIPNNFYNVPSSGIVPQPSGGYSYAGHSIALIGLTSINGKQHWIAQNSWGTGWGKNGLCYIPYDWGCGVQSPRDASNTSEVCGWTQDCYAVWNNNAAASNPEAPVITSATQNTPDATATVAWSNRTSGANTILYARRVGTTDWWPKPYYGANFTGTNGTIYFDDAYGDYELMAIAFYDNVLSQQSAVYRLSVIRGPDPWSWTISNGTATASQTSRAYHALVSKGSLSNFSHLVWNDLCDKVNEVTVAVNETWVSTWGSLSATKMSASDTLLTARRFNALKNNVGYHVSTGIANVAVGDPVVGAYFITIANCLNQWINSL